MLRFLKHFGIVFASVAILIGIPSAIYFDIFSKKSDVDAVSRASMELPEQPSGDFVVLINNALHAATVTDWEDFFCDRDYNVLMDDVNCLVAIGDVSGIQMAERFQARLAENQMQIRRENSLLLVSKAEQGLIDVAVFSKEMANALGFDEGKNIDNVTVITVKGGAI